MADGQLDFCCFAVAANLIVFTPVGALIGYFARGRAGEGAGLGFLFGPIGWFAVLLLKDVRRKCQACRSRVPDYAATKCRRCGSDLPPEVPPSVEMPPYVRAIGVGFIVFMLALFAASMAGQAVVYSQFGAGGRQSQFHESHDYYSKVSTAVAISVAVLLGAAVGLATYTLRRAPPVAQPIARPTRPIPISPKPPPRAP